MNHLKSQILKGSSSENLPFLSPFHFYTVMEPRSYGCNSCILLSMQTKTSL